MSDFTKQSNLDKVVKATNEGIEVANIAIASNVVTQTKLLAPVNKEKGLGGQLRNSYMWRTLGQEGGFNDSPGEQAKEKITVKPDKNEAFVGSNLIDPPYNIYQEFGTRYMDAQPHLRPAIDLVVKGEAVNLVKDRLNKKMYEHVPRVNV